MICQQWFSVAGLLLDIVGFVIIAREWYWSIHLSGADKVREIGGEKIEPWERTAASREIAPAQIPNVCSIVVSAGFEGPKGRLQGTIGDPRHYVSGHPVAAARVSSVRFTIAAAQNAT